MDAHEYTVTELAGRSVAGRLVAKGDNLVLTPAEAEHPLREGQIVPKGKELAKAYTEGSKRMDELRAEAAEVKARTPAATGPAVVETPIAAMAEPASAGLPSAEPASTAENGAAKTRSKAV